MISTSLWRVSRPNPREEENRKGGRVLMSKNHNPRGEAQRRTAWREIPLKAGGSHADGSPPTSAASLVRLLPFLGLLICKE